MSEPPHSASRIGVLATLSCSPDQRAGVLTALRDLAAASTTEPGTLLFDIFADRDDPNVITVYEIYADDAAVQAHRGSAAMERFRAALKAEGIRPEIRWLHSVDPEGEPA